MRGTWVGFLSAAALFISAPAMAASSTLPSVAAIPADRGQIFRCRDDREDLALVYQTIPERRIIEELARWPNLPAEETRGYHQSLLDYLADLRAVAPELASALGTAWGHFVFKAHMSDSARYDILPDPRWQGEHIRCETLRFIRRPLHRLPLDPPFTVNLLFWNSLTGNQQAQVVLHFLAVEEAFHRGATDSAGADELVALLVSESLGRMPRAEARAELRRLGF